MTRMIRFALVGVLALGIPLLCPADTLKKWIGYSGFLVDAGVPVDAPTELTFRIYKQATGDVPPAVWEEAWTGTNIVDVKQGEFSVNLGSIVSLDAVKFQDNVQYWLGIQIGSDTELSGRKMLLPVPYSFKSEIETRADDPASTDLYTGRMWLRTDF